MNHYHFGLRTLKGVLRNCSPLVSEFGEGENGSGKFEKSDFTIAR